MLAKRKNGHKFGVAKMNEAIEIEEVRPPEADMTDEEILAALQAEPEPTPLPEGVKPPKWNKLTPGQQVLAIAEQNNMPMSPEDRAALESAENDELVKQFMKCGFGKHEALDTTLAKSIFSGMLMNRIDLPGMLATCQYYNLVGTEKAIEYAEQLKISANDITDPERREAAKLQAAKLELFARKLSSDMAKRAHGIAQQVMPKEAPQRGKNRPPDVFNQQININVAPASGVKTAPA